MGEKLSIYPAFLKGAIIQGNKITKEKFLFIEVFQLINEVIELKYPHFQCLTK